MGVDILPGNKFAVHVFFTIRQFGPITFGSIDRALIRFGVDDISVFDKVGILNKEFNEIKAKKAEAKRNNNGSKRR
jgi:hypothetical protein